MSNPCKNKKKKYGSIEKILINQNTQIKNNSLNDYELIIE